MSYFWFRVPTRVLLDKTRAKDDSPVFLFLFFGFSEYEYTLVYVSVLGLLRKTGRSDDKKKMKNENEKQT